jgi:RNA polymerase sigma factor (sigma-70 family)
MSNSAEYHLATFRDFTTSKRRNHSSRIQAGSETGEAQTTDDTMQVNPETEHNDERLAARCRNGDVEAFRELYETHKATLYSYAYRFHGNTQDAEDSLQEAFLVAFRKIGSYRGEARLATWLFRIVSNTCISRTRARRNTEEVRDFSDEYYHPMQHHVIGDVALFDILEEEIARLPDMQRAVFLLCANKEFHHEEVASILSISVGTSKSYYHRAKEQLKNRLLHRGINLSEVSA